jgi:Domain of Unknown Function (DUF748)
MLAIGRRSWRWLLVATLVPVVLLVAADFLLDEPIRRQLERRMNERLTGYSAAVGRADFHVLGFGIDLEDVVVVQQANPDPPVAQVGRLAASVQWRELLTGNVVANFLMYRPVVHFNLEHFRKEQQDETPVEKRGWQEAIESIYPFEINEFRIVDGEVTYQDRGPYKPLHLTAINFEAGNIRNVRGRPHDYPSPIHLEAVVFETGKVTADGHANFLAEPHLGLKANVGIQGVPLDYFKPITERYNLTVRRGTLSLAGTAEWRHDGGTLVHLRELTGDRLDIDYVHAVATKAAEQQTAQQAKETAKEVSNKPEMLLRVDHARVTGTLGFVNRAAEPDYRMFLSEATIDLKNLSNRFTEGTAVAAVRGKFMGSGATIADANFRPEKNGPDFDLAVKIENTDMRAMNDVLRAYGKFDVVSGLFSFYSELSVKNQRVEGYVKPLYRDLKAYDERQDAEKSAFRKLYEKLVGGVSKLLENRPRDEVATKAEVAGRLDDPKTSTGQVLVNLVRNAFFRAILPGFDEELGRLR